MSSSDPVFRPLDRLRGNLEGIRRRIAESADRAGRDPSDVTLVVVTKSVPRALVEMLPAAGVADAAENRLQIAEKKDFGSVPGLRRHFIGHLQRNKTRRVLEIFPVIHSADSVRLLRAIDRVAGETGRRPTVLLQVNVSGEDRKHGVDPGEVAAVLAHAAPLESLDLVGFMGMAPFVEDPEDARPAFRLLREIRDEANRSSRYRAPLSELSMGMTNDFEIAVEEGATMVRIGTAVFEGVEAAAGGSGPSSASVEQPR